MKLPDGFGAGLLLFALALVVAAFLPDATGADGEGLKIGSLEIPSLAPGVKRKLRVMAPALMLFSLLLYLPVWPIGELLTAEIVAERPPVFEDSSDLARLMTPQAAER